MLLFAALLQAATPTVNDRIEKARTEINAVENAANRAVYACTRNQVEKCTTESKAAANAASRALYAIDQAKKALQPPPPPPADAWLQFPLTDPARGLDKSTYARAVSSCPPVFPGWGPTLVAGAIYRLEGWGTDQGRDHWSVVAEGAGPRTATNMSTVATVCLVGVYKVKPTVAWTSM